jgi:hypothetical protein
MDLSKQLYVGSTNLYEFLFEPQPSLLTVSSSSCLQPPTFFLNVPIA